MNRIGLGFTVFGYDAGMKRFLLALFLTTAGVAQTQVAPASYRVADITLYGLDERVAVFYGEPGSLKQGANTLTLTKPNGVVAGLDVAGSLRVGGSGSLALPAPKLTAFNLIRGTEGLRLITRVPLTAVYLYTDSKWFTLTGPISGGQNLPVYQTPRASLYGAGGLSLNEAAALSRYLNSKGPELVVGVIPTTPSPVTFSPAPSSYRSTALSVQVGVRDVPSAPPVVLNNPPVAPDAPSSGTLPWTNPAPSTESSTILNTSVNMISSGSQSQFQGTDLETRLDSTPEDFAATWALVSGGQIPAQAAPFVDFTRSRVVTVFLGQKSTGGYGLQLLNASLNGDTLTLQLETSEPAPGRLLTQAFTSPYLMLEVDAGVNVVSVELVPVTR